MPLPAGDERAHAVSGAQRKDLLLQNIIVLKPVFLARGVKDPVADIDEIQQPPELLVGELNVHPVIPPDGSSAPEKMAGIRSGRRRMRLCYHYSKR